MNLYWLTAPDREVAAAVEAQRRESRPRWVPTKREMLVHVNRALILWYLCLACLPIGIKIDGTQDGVATPGDITAFTIVLVILAVWIVGTWRLEKWAKLPPSPRARMKEWRRMLTALANGFEPEASRTATFAALITAAPRGVFHYPRFAAPGVEFGTLTERRRRGDTWQYIAVKLPSPLPHLILDATANNRVRSDLPVGVGRGQRLSLEGDFDRWFHLYSPAAYGTDAYSVLTPDVMAALIDDASAYNVEIVDDVLVFFTTAAVDFTAPEHWEKVGAVLAGVAPRIARRAREYRDERVPGQAEPRVITALRFGLESDGKPWVEPRSRIGADGRRLDIRDRRQRNRMVMALAAVGYFAFLVFLYAIPAIFGFAGFMSIVDGK
ncbi:hypothetical protein [Microbacterium sp. P04]|uniref:hypothetical protein n=1 Tax=Microbacterium sp. P04 TaxID=3366947 RepID=UPI0037464A1B